MFIVHRQVGQAAGIVKLDSDSGAQLSFLQETEQGGGAGGGTGRVESQEKRGREVYGRFKKGGWEEGFQGGKN